MVAASVFALLAAGAAPPGQIRLANLPDEAPVHLGVSLRTRDADGLSRLLAAQRDPASPSYHAWLDPQTFGARFGLPEADYDAILSWFAARGFAVTGYPNRSFFEAVGRVDALRSTLGVQAHRAELAGRRFRTFEGKISLPEKIGARILHISGLDTRLRHRPRPRVIAYGFDGGVLGPDDLRLEYDMSALVSAGKAAAGLTTVVLGTQEGTTTPEECYSGSSGSPPIVPPSTTAIAAYFQLANATATYDPIVLPNPNDDLDGCGANQEYQLDVEMQAVGAANAADIALVMSPASEFFTTGVQYIVNQLPTAVAVSTSIGECESEEAAGGGPTTAGSEMQAMQQAIDQGLVEGQTWFAAAGDTGADDCGDYNSGTGNGFDGGNATVDFPGSLPEIMDMGGSQFGGTPSWSAGGSLLAAVTEVVWNEGQQYGAGGGGHSGYYAKPAYQVGVGPAAGDGARDVPDLSLASALATPGVAVYGCGDGQDATCQGEDTGTGWLDVFGGTSIASPLAAGMFALLAGEVGCRQGDVHDEIYALGNAEQDGGARVFNDVTSGNNDFVDVYGDTISGFSAGPGYDLATGWGSIDMAVLVTSWPACGTSTGGTSTGGGTSSGTSTGPATSTGTSSGGGTTGGTTGGTSSGSSTGARASSSGGRATTGTTTGVGMEEAVSAGGCSCADGGGETALVWVPFGLGLLGLRLRRRER